MPEAAKSPPEQLVHGLTRAQLHEIFRAMAVTREAEERLELLFKQGHVGGGVFRSLGQEAGAVGAAYSLSRRDDGTGDLLAQTLRATGAVFIMGGTPTDYFRQHLARATGPTSGRDTNVHWGDFSRGLLGPVSPLGTMVEVMAGATLSFKLRGQDRVGVVFAGDGASSTGAWHEGLNFAAAQGCPMVLLVEANRWAFSSPTSTNTRVDSFTEKAEGYGLHATSVDGTDVLAVYQVVRDAVEIARNGGGTGMVELRYNRRAGHAQHDAQEYVDVAEEAEWLARDPIGLYRTRLIEEGWATPEELDRIQAEVVEVVRGAAEQALSEPHPDGRSAIADVYTDLDGRRPWTRGPFPPGQGPDPAVSEPTTSVTMEATTAEAPKIGGNLA
jgi:TPP-dependent pyruvate/acetoin dehydrogenase alpha subunit